MTSRILTPANQITILRLVFVPVFAIWVIERSYRGALVVLVAAAISDAVDGAVARSFHQESPLGVALDPLADKILMATAYLALAFREALPWWLTILVLSRDIAILVTALLISLVAGYRPFHPTILGKVSTVAQVATLFAAVSLGAHIPLVTRFMVQTCIMLAAAFTVASGIHYLVICQSRYGQRSTEQSVPVSSRITRVKRIEGSAATVSPTKSASSGSS